MATSKPIEAQKVDMIYAVPTVLYRMLEMNLPRRHDLSSLKTTRYGGSPISPAKLEILLDLFGQIFVQGYGSTECWPSITILGRKDHNTRTQEQINRLLSVGRPMPGEEVIVCDRDGKQLPAGQRGEIWIRGPNTITGYYKAPALTKINFSSSGFWKSGDMGYMDENDYLFIMDRSKDMIISGGENIYPREIEEVLIRHPAVNEVSVIGVPDDKWGEAIKAVVVLAPGKAASEDELIAYCKENIASYKKPKSVDFVEKLPKNNYGKILKRELRELYWKNHDRKV